MVRRIFLITIVTIVTVLGGNAAAEETVLDTFEDLSGWTATASPGSTAEIGRAPGVDGQAMRLDFDLGIGGFVIVRKAFDIELPANYAFSFRIRGEAPPNNLELKLVDPRGDDVWWAVERDFEFPHEWERVVMRKSRFRFAWGSSLGAPLERVGFIEIAISAGSGGRGSVWIDDLVFTPRPARPPTPPPPELTASTSLPDSSPGAAFDGDLATAWHSGSVAEQQWLALDLKVPREFGGLVIDWAPDDFATSYRVELSDDGETWTERYRSDTGAGRRSYVYLHDSEARWVRLVLERSSRGQGYGIREIHLEPLEFSATPNDFFAALARDARRGLFPRYLTGEQSYWTVVGVPGAMNEALVDEEGRVEVVAGSFSIEPFVFSDGQLVTWRDVETSQSLAHGYLPIPTVTWRHERFTLEIEPLAHRDGDFSALYVRYRLTNTLHARRDPLLFLAIRPFQVLPPWQSLNMVGGATRVRTLRLDEQTVVVNGERRVVSLTPPDRFGAATFEQDLMSSYLERGSVPQTESIVDGFGYASGALEYRLPLEPGAFADVVLEVPFEPGIGPAPTPIPEAPSAAFARLRAAAEASWERLLDRVELDIPADDQRIAETVKSTIAYIEVNRDGPAIQPGSRTYARSWIRDGAFTSSALLAFGHTEQVRNFLRWYAAFQLPDGRIPCCVDRRGAERVPENDSNGEFIYTLAEYYRFTRDVGLVYEIWPTVVRAVDWIEAMRATRLGPEYETEDGLPFRGLLPESISHEGYSAHPVHSYWDDFFALRGLRDAADLAVVVSDEANAARFAALRDAFRADLYASLERTMARHGITFIPGSVELGDFDATSTAAAVTPCGELASLPRAALDDTFDRYLQYVRERSSRPPNDEGYTPYEMRNVAALVMMGRREEAFWLLRLLLADRRPPEWNHWGEIVWRNPVAPRFIGDMPHTWVGAGFLRAVRTMFVYEDEAAKALVVGAGLPADWVLDGSGVRALRLPTHYGVLSYSLRRDGDAALVFALSGDLDVPPGGIVLDPPLPAPLTSVTVNGKRRAVDGPGPLRIDEFPAVVRLAWGAADSSPAAPAGAVEP